MDKRDQIRIAIALAALAVGALVYIFDRPVEQISFLTTNEFIKANKGYWSSFRHSFGPLGWYLPTFIHPLAFSLITAGVFACRSNITLAVIGLAWCLFNLFFEIGQASIVYTKILPQLTDWFGSNTLLEHSKTYFHNGTFDFKDIYSIILGTGVAFLINYYPKKKSN